MLSSHIMSTQPLHERIPLWSPGSGANSAYDSGANSDYSATSSEYDSEANLIDRVEPPRPVYIRLSNNIPPIPYPDLLPYTPPHEHHTADPTTSSLVQPPPPIMMPRPPVPVVEIQLLPLPPSPIGEPDTLPHSEVPLPSSCNCGWAVGVAVLGLIATGITFLCCCCFGHNVCSCCACQICGCCTGRDCSHCCYVCCCWC